MHILAKKKVEKDEDSISVPAKYIHTILCYLLSLNCAKTEALKEEQRNRDFLPIPKCNKKPSYKHKLFYFFLCFFWRYSVLKDAEHFLPTMHWQCTCKPTHRVINVASTSFTWSHPLPKLVVLIWVFSPPADIRLQLTCHFVVLSDRHFNNQNELTMHMQTHRPRNTACPVCGEIRFASAANAVAHVESGSCSGCRGTIILSYMGVSRYFLIQRATLQLFHPSLARNSDGALLEGRACMLGVPLTLVVPFSDTAHNKYCSRYIPHTYWHISWIHAENANS